MMIESVNQYQREYKYDVAFSFLKEDEELATSMNDLIQNRLSTFLYSKRQEEIAGLDGEQGFNDVFTAKSRIVTVLYRLGWGTTPWTRIEETAIRNRAYEEGYDFVIFIPLDQPPSVPTWLPKNRIWVGIDRWGVEGAASVIESRVQEAGGTPRRESLEEYAIRKKHDIDSEQKRSQFLDSPEAIEYCMKECKNLLDVLQMNASKIATVANYQFKDARAAWYFDIWGYGYGLGIEHSRIEQFPPAKTSVEIVIWEGTPIRPGRPFSGNPRKRQQKSLLFDTDSHGTIGWRDKTSNRLLSAQDVADLCLRLFIDQIHRGSTQDRA